MDKNLEILKRLIIEADEEETKVDSETTQVKEKPKNTAFEKDPMGFILKKYNTLNEIMIELMTKDFREFVDAIFYIAPKPTTFKIQLHNGQNFFLTYMKDNIYEAIIGGKRYYLAGIGEKERCMMAIARLLRFGTPLKTKGAEGAEEGTRDNTGMEGDWAANGGSGGGTETGSEEEVTASTEETGEELTENIKILTRLLMEIKKEEGTNLEDKILNLLSKDSTIAEYNPYKVQRDSGNNYKVYFKNVNTKDKKGRRDIQTLLTKVKGITKGQVVPKNVSWSSIGYAQLETKFGPVNISVKGFSENATTTDVKEGLVIPFYYSSLESLITEDTFESSIKATIKATTDNQELIGPKLATELLKYLNSIENTKENIKIINQPLSQALAIYAAYPQGYELNRGDILNDYRKFASAQLNMNYDKWCPADVYLIIREGGARERLKKAIKASKEDTPGSAIEVLNNTFNEKWGGTLKPITGISLKFEKAQGGKAKGYLETLTTDKTKYNLSKEEQNYDQKQYIKKIEEARSKLEASIGSVDGITYNLKNADKNINQDLDFLRGKFAALKCLNFFFDQFEANKYDDALLALAAFAMSLGDTSPAFFKITASTKGKASVETFPRGASLSLLENGDEYEIIDVEDSQTNAAVLVKMKVSKGGSPYNVQIAARSNGGVQGTMELTTNPIK